jgi:hypothetical protein
LEFISNRNRLLIAVLSGNPEEVVKGFRRWAISPPVTVGFSDDFDFTLRDENHFDEDFPRPVLEEVIA